MEYWEFLIQKEGDRNWQPIKPSGIELEGGRYRVVAHSSRRNADVEICVTYTSTEEIPPKRRSQKRSRRTNPEGLMVVIPYTHLKPGLWELRCGGDIMSDFLGNSWQESAQLRVVPKVADVLPACEPTSPVIEMNSSPHPQGDEVSDVPFGKSFAQQGSWFMVHCNEQSTINNEPDGFHPHPQEDEALPPPLVEAIHAEPENGREGEEENIQPKLEISSSVPISDIPHPSFEEAEPLSASLLDAEMFGEPVDATEEPVALTSQSLDLVTTANPILDQSLQALEHILQQVLEPVLKDFERSDPLDSETEAFEPKLLLEPDCGQGLTLSLDQDALVTRQGECLTITGRVEIDRQNGSEPSEALTNRFQGSLRYELSDPQTSKVLLAIQQPLAEQALPLVFSHSLEIPPECNTRLILGKVTLYGSNSAALATQPFTVTTDLDKLLGAIIPGSKVMPVAKMLVLASNPTAFQDAQQEASETAEPPLNQALLDLINLSQTQPLSLQPKSKQSLPPQLYQPTSTQKTSKSLDLPNFPKIQPSETSAEAVADLSVSELLDVEPEARAQGNGKVDFEFEQEPADSLGDTELESQLKEVFEGDTQKQNTQTGGGTDAENSATQRPSVIGSETAFQEQAASTDFSQLIDTTNLSSVWYEIELPDSSVSVVDSELAQSETRATPDASESTKDSQVDSATDTDTRTSVTNSPDSPLSESEVREVLNATKEERQAAKGTGVRSIADQPAAVDNAFQSLNVQDRFWLRLNSLASDAELSEWLKWEGSMARDAAEVEEVVRSPEPDTGLVEVEEVTQSLDSDPELTDFDESLWEESEQFSGESGDPAELQPPPWEEESSPEEEMLDQPPLKGIAPTDWAGEIVVDDEEQSAPQQSIVRGDASGMSYPTESLGWQPEPKIPSSPELELPLPAPTIFIPTSELPAGEPVTLRIKLPPHPARLCVKLWVQDRQSRSLLDGPRWLVDLIPDGAGQLEAMTQLIVPFGSVEIRFEAIAVDIYTQRESHKVTVDCVVVPPDLPNISLDEFED